MTNNCGIYQITNTATGDFYIGSSYNIERRLADHRRRLSNNRHENPHLQNSWNKHGEQAFGFLILEQCEKEQLIEREQYFIDSESPSYNICQIAGNCLGVKHTEAARENMSAARMGNTNCLGHKHSPETLALMSAAMKGKNKGKHRTEEQNRNNSEAQKGKHPSPETLVLMSAAQKSNTNCLGRIVSAETRALISAAAKRREAKRKAALLLVATGGTL